jgi:hypothetical protein
VCEPFVTRQISIRQSDSVQTDLSICCQQLQKLFWRQGRWRGADVTKECLETNFHLSSTLLRKLWVHCANGFDNVGSVYFFYSNPVFHCYVNNATIPCRSQELLPFLSVIHFFLSLFSTNYSSILPHPPILPSISWSCCFQNLYKILFWEWGTRWRSDWGTALQTGRSRVRFLMVSLEFFIDIILPAALWPWGRLSL